MDANGGYGILEVKLFLESLPFVLEGEDFVGAQLFVNLGVDGHRFDEGVRRFDQIFVMRAYSGSSRMRASEPCRPPQAVVLMGATIWAICSVIRFMVLVVGCPMMTSSGLVNMRRLTV